MRTTMLMVVVWVSLAAGVGFAQLEKDAEKAFEQRVQGQSLYLRNFSGDEKVRARVDGSAVRFDEPAMHMVAAVVVDSVNVKGGTVVMSGNHAFTGGDGALLRSPVQVVVDLGGGDRAAVWDGLRDELFFATASEALATVPRERGGTGPEDRTFNRALTSPYGSGRRGTCDCADYGTPACRGKTAIEGGTPLKLLHPTAAEFSEEARRAKVSGNVTLSFTVDENGKAVDFWVVRPLGKGLDRKAVEAAEQYGFQPAACHDKAIRSPMSIEVNFQVF